MHTRLHISGHVKDLHKLQGYLRYTSLCYFTCLHSYLMETYLTWGNTNFHSSILFSTKTVTHNFSHILSIVIYIVLSMQNCHCWHLAHDILYSSTANEQPVLQNTFLKCSNHLSLWLSTNTPCQRWWQEDWVGWFTSAQQGGTACSTFMSMTIRHLCITTTAGGQKFILWLGDHRKGVMVHNTKFLKYVSWIKAYKHNCQGKKPLTCQWLYTHPKFSLK
jgi:hypothetical protein